MIAKKWLPLPKVAYGKYGKVKCFCLDWLVPKILATFTLCSPIYHILKAVSDDAALQKDPIATTLVLDAIVTKIEVLDNLGLSIAAIAVVLSAAAAYWLQHFELKRSRPFFTRRPSKKLDVVAYWLSITAASVFGFFLVPLGLGLTIGIVAKSSALVFNIGSLIFVDVTIAYMLFLFAYDQNEQPEILVVSVTRLSTAMVDPSQREMLNDRLTKTGDALSAIFHGLWSRQVLVNKDGSHGCLTVGFRNSHINSSAGQMTMYRKTIDDQSKFWAQQGYSSQVIDHARPFTLTKEVDSFKGFQISRVKRSTPRKRAHSPKVR